MIISFSMENWMSFRDQVSFSMVASREKQHSNRIPRVKKYQTRILPVAAIYGANASGKTNFFNALVFIRYLVTEGTAPDKLIPVEPYKLDGAYSEKPSRFSLELLIDETIYEFSFGATSKSITEERLVEITKTSEKTLYDRKDDNPNFHSSLNKDEFLHFAFQGTRDNQLFLTNSVSQKVDRFKSVYSWFQNTLNLIAPASVYKDFRNFLDKRHPLHSRMNEVLSQLDTGISRLSGEEVSFENIPFEENFKNELRKSVREGEYVPIFFPPTNERFVFTRNAGEIVAKKLFALHSKPDGTDVRFEIWQESAGSQRLIDLLPAFLPGISSSNRVIVIDELDQSLHTLLTRKLIEMYLDNCSSQSRSQLLFTTHDVLLMDQDLLRRDEMWVAERNQEGVSDIFSFSEYGDIRYDKDIRKSYLQGRLGGIPRILLSADNTLADHKHSD